MAVEVEASRRRFTVEEFGRMAELGIFKPTERVELIRGEIVEMTSPGPRHIAFVNNLTQLLVIRLAGRGIVSVQNPVVLSDDSEPKPDLAVLRRRSGSYKEASPATGDVLLLIEVAETSLRYDRTTKLRLYAEVGIPEYWVIDCVAETIDRYRAPSADGYGDVVRLTGAAAISPLAFSDVTCTLPEIFA